MMNDMFTYFHSKILSQRYDQVWEYYVIPRH